MHQSAVVPYDPHVASLYTPVSLLLGVDSSGRSLDSRIVAHYQARGGREPDSEEALSQRLHDFSIEQARDTWIGDRHRRRLVGVMGGHDLARGHAAYRRAAELGWRLARSGRLVVTGGGPGAMEAAHLGAQLQHADESTLDSALDLLATAPDYRDWRPYFQTAVRVLNEFQGDGESLSVPTWYYAQEPTNVFASHIAKYFSNSLREDGLITVALDGVVYLPGRAGTVQEVFQDAAQNYYGADYARTPWVSPMVFLPGGDPSEQSLVDRVVALVSELARIGQATNPAFAKVVGSVLTPEQAIAFLDAHPPTHLGS